MRQVAFALLSISVVLLLALDALAHTPSRGADSKSDHDPGRAETERNRPSLDRPRAAAGFRLDLVKPTDRRTSHAPRPPSHRDPRRRRGRVLAPDGGG